MDLRKIADHTVDLDLLPEEPTVLDVGARNFIFSKGILQIRPKAKVYALEPDSTVNAPEDPRINFIRAALVHDERQEAGYAGWSTGEGNYLTENPPHYATQIERVACINLERINDNADVTHWDLIKLDCERSEFPFLESLTKPPADQLSIEFHDYDEKCRDDAYFGQLFKHLSWYEVVSHPLTGVGPNSDAYGHWDSLLILKSKRPA